MLKLNFIYYFNITFNNLLLLLLVIISHGIILLKFKITKYFYFDFRNNESNWFFYIAININYIINAVKTLKRYKIV